MIQITDNSTIAKGDCLTLIKSIPDHSIDLILTDPPYNLGNFMHKRGTNIKGMRNNHFAYSGWDNLSFEEWSNVMKLFLQECNRVLKTKGSLLMFMSILKSLSEKKGMSQANLIEYLVRKESDALQQKDQYEQDKENTTL